MNKIILKTEDAKKIKIDEIYTRFSSSKNGLTSEEAKKRIIEYGPNDVPEKKSNPVIKFLKYFWGPIPWMIEIALILSAVLSHWEDFGVIFVLLMINGIVRFTEEHRADNAIEMLKKRLAVKANVLRDGKWVVISSKEIVPGDIVRIKLGDIVPADVKLLEGDYLSVDESALTGESLPVEKKNSDIGYSGSIIQRGEMKAMVINTGINTFFGKTAKLVEEAKTVSHFQKAVIKIGNYLIILSVVLVIIVFLVELILRHQGILNTLQFGLVLIIAAIPAALPAVLSVTMVVGAIALARRGAIVSRLLSIEEMAGADILCSDKTGTITKNEISISKIEPFEEFEKKDILLFAGIISKEQNMSSIDYAILKEGQKNEGMDNTIKNFKIIKFTPFDPVSKRAEVTVEGPDKKIFKISNGAPQVILSLINANNGQLINKVKKSVEDFAIDGYRALGVAKTDKENNWHFIGLLGLSDTAREDSAETIKEAMTMGLDIKMVTGDHIDIAKKIAKEVDLGTNIINTSSFLNKSDTEATDIIEKSDGFSEVFPEDKYHIVELFQKKGHIVAMTGDGVNDSPALKKADVGIAVSGATDAAKSAAGIVFTKPGLSVIIEALKQSRQIFVRMNNYSIYRIAETIRVLLFLVLTILIFNLYPLTTIMIVLLALLNDIPIMMIAYDNAVLPEKPVKWNMKNVLGLASLLGIVGVISSFGFFLIAKNVLQLNPSMLQTIIFLKLIVAGHLTIYITRTDRYSFWSKPLPSSKLFITAEATQILATFFAVYGVLMTAIGWKLAVFVWGYALLLFIITNYIKVIFYKMIDNIKTRSKKSGIHSTG